MEYRFGGTNIGWHRRHFQKISNYQLYSFLFTIRFVRQFWTKLCFYRTQRWITVRFLFIFFFISLITDKIKKKLRRLVCKIEKLVLKNINRRFISWIDSRVVEPVIEWIAFLQSNILVDRFLGLVLLIQRI